MNPDQTAKREEALGGQSEQIEKEYGKGAILQLDKMEADIEGISTGACRSISRWAARGFLAGGSSRCMGLSLRERRRWRCMSRPAQEKAGGVAAVIDAEHAMNPNWAKKCGINLEQLLVSQPESGEQALEICEMLVRSGSLDVIIVNSVAALIPRAELEGNMGNAQVGSQARLHALVGPCAN